MKEVVLIELPASELGGGHVGRHVGTRLTPVQARGMKRLRDSLVARGVVLSNGRAVTNSASAIRWVLERYEAGVVDVVD